MEQKDTKAVQELINTYLKQFNLAPVMDEEEVAHWFLPRDHIIDTYVVEVKYALTYMNVSATDSSSYQRQVFERQAVWNMCVIGRIWYHEYKLCSLYYIPLIRKCLAVINCSGLIEYLKEELHMF